VEHLSQTKSQSWLVWFLRGFLVLGFLILFGRLLDLQVIKGSYFRVLSEENRIRRVPILAPRGKILARGGEVLVDNKEVKKKIMFDPLSGFEKVDVVEGGSDESLITEWVRDYKMGAALAHVTGYVGEVNADELGKIRGQCPDKGPRRLGGIVGRTGLEQQYECRLSGVDGEELIEVDATGRQVRVLGKRDPIPGEDLKTTIDYGLQQKVYSLMKDKRGAVVITDERGQILALVSTPSYDPNVLVSDDDSTKRSQVITDENLPLFNRAIGGTFHPGSTFKPIVAISALQEGKIDKNYTFDDTGQIVIKTIYGTYSYKNWYFTQYGGVEGNINLVRALARSTDTFFYKVGELTGIDGIDKWAQALGLSDKTGIDLPGEVTGLVPGPVWKMRVKGERWFLGDTYNVSIGQGDLAVTPVELNSSILAIANGGYLCRPGLFSTDDTMKDRCKQVDLSDENTELVKKGMEGVCEAGGTAYPFFGFSETSGVKVGCKTGTAQNVNEDPHAWFVAFAPAEEPEIIATVLVENGGEGSQVAAPIAREIFNYWFKVPVSPTPMPSPAE
jgi:penicillin-binding protein 2